MRERGIHFNSEMVRAVMEGRKVQTRRIMKVQPVSPELELSLIIESTRRTDDGKFFWREPGSFVNNRRSVLFSCPFGAVGDRLWVRENFYQHGRIHQPYFGEATDPEDAYFLGDKRVLYPADGVALPPQRQRDDFWRSKPSIHMPRWASRITLEITGVRVERLNSISGEDARSEGFAYEGSHILGDIDEFSRTWTSIYGEESWQANPWVWVIEFKRVEGE